MSDLPPINFYRPETPFNVFAAARQSLPCGCQIHRDIDGNATGWDPCDECGPYIARVVKWAAFAGLVTASEGTLDDALTITARPGGRWLDGSEN